MRRLFIAGAAVAMLFMSAGKAVACSCAGVEVPCQAYGQASAVFVGTVIESRVVTVKRGNYDTQRRVVRLTIDSPFRGVAGAEVEVQTGLGGGDCGFGFVQTQQYLVYAYEHEGKLSTGICTRTRSIAKAAEDLSYIQSLATAKPGATISGEVVRYRRNEQGGLDNQPMAGITVTIDGQTKREIKTNTKGQYRVEGLPVGEYLVTVTLPEGFDTRGAPEQKVTVTDRGCSVMDFWLQPEGKLSDRVLNPQGLPVKNAEIFISNSFSRILSSM
jgi:Carboxypeptidase regulatory-like domain/Tissue inhibitor of metalloproteinase